MVPAGKALVGVKMTLAPRSVSCVENVPGISVLPEVTRNVLAVTERLATGKFNSATMVESAVTTLPLVGCSRVTSSSTAGSVCTVVEPLSVPTSTLAPEKLTPVVTSGSCAVRISEGVAPLTSYTYTRFDSVT